MSKIINFKDLLLSDNNYLFNNDEILCNVTKFEGSDEYILHPIEYPDIRIKYTIYSMDYITEDYDFLKSSISVCLKSNIFVNNQCKIVRIISYYPLYLSIFVVSSNNSNIFMDQMIQYSKNRKKKLESLNGGLKKYEKENI